MDKEFWKFIEFEGSGRPHRGDGMIEAFRLLVCCPPAQMLIYSLTKKQTGDSSISVARASSVRGRTGSLTEQRADLASARAQHYCD